MPPDETRQDGVVVQFLREFMAGDAAMRAFWYLADLKSHMDVNVQHVQPDLVRLTIIAKAREN